MAIRVVGRQAGGLFCTHRPSVPVAIAHTRAAVYNWRFASTTPTTLHTISSFCHHPDATIAHAGSGTPAESISPSSLDVARRTDSEKGMNQMDVTRLVGQLQQLAARHVPPDYLKSGTNTFTSAEEDVEISKLHDEGEKMTVNVSVIADGTADPHGAWQKALRLVQDGPHSTEVAAWLLFVCLRSLDPVMPSRRGASLEVCEGVYATWRQWLRDGETFNPETQASAPPTERTASISSSAGASQSSLVRSPFHPKGIHHHYATHLLTACHAALDELQAASRHAQDAAEEAETLHRVYYLLNRAFEVLLVDLPEDAAALLHHSAAALRAASPTSRKRHRPRTSKGRPVLRPTSALLVLEASRLLARCFSSHSGDVTSFPMLAFLVGEMANGNGDAEATLSNVRTTPLAAVAKAALECVLQRAPPAGATPAQRMRGDALVLYMGFLVSSVSAEMHSALDVDAFVYAGSHTARHFSASRHVTGAEENPFDTTETVRVLSWVARVVLFAYLTEERSVSAAVRQTQEGFLAVMTEHIPEGLTAVYAPDPAQEMRKSTLEADSNGDIEHLSRSPRPISWCAWLVRLLVRDLERAQEAPAASFSLASSKQSPRASLQNRGDTPPAVSAWQLQSELTLSLLRRLIVALQQQAQAAHGASAAVSISHRQATATRRPTQEVWRVLLAAALRGTFFVASPSAPAAAPKRSYTQPREQRWKPSSTDLVLSPSGTPAFLPQLFFAHYGTPEWRRPTVNLYVFLLDQWGQGTQIRQVFAAVTRRERRFQEEVRTAVRLESDRAAADGDHDEEDASPIQRHEEKQEESARRSARSIFRRYRPALTLESCLVTLRYCGCAPDALTKVHRPLRSERREEVDYAVDEEGSPSRTRAFASSNAHGKANARLAGEVLQYILCVLHVAQHTPTSPRTSRDDAPSTGENATVTHVPVEDVGANMNDNALPVDDKPSSEVSWEHERTVDGVPVSQWSAWMRRHAVPAVAELYRGAGIEEEWAELGY